MSEPLIITHTEEAITTITLNRPEKRNALNGEMIKILTEELHNLAHHSKTRVLIIKANGEAFCAGADIDWMKKISASSYDENYDDAQYLADFLYQLYTFPQPTLALAHGAVLGGGLGIVSACDIAIAADNASFGFPEVKIGLTPSCISPYLLAAMGERIVRYYMLTGERFTAKEAVDFRLVHKEVVAGDLHEKGFSLAQTLLLNGPEALRAAKQLIHAVNKEKITEALIQKTAEHLANIRRSKEAQEGLQAFLEKRQTKWQG